MTRWDACFPKSVIGGPEHCFPMQLILRCHHPIGSFGAQQSRDPCDV
jgi:hypothetical protein